ncbi:MAG: NifU family protein [Acidimicrobiales bacterium]
MTSVDTFEVLALSDEAREVVRDALAGEAGHDALALFVEVTGTRGAGYTYDLYFSDLGGAPEGAAIGRDGSIDIVIPAASVARLRGSRLEYATDNGGGLVLVNPNAPTAEELNPGVPPEVLAFGVEGDLGRRAVAVLDNDVNPAIASHGGRADLVAMDEDKHIAYLRLSGGCQGCAMSRLTLSQGIEASLRDALPELEAVVDVTDHASGVNPFYSHED